MTSCRMERIIVSGNNKNDDRKTEEKRRNERKSTPERHLFLDIFFGVFGLSFLLVEIVMTLNLRDIHTSCICRKTTTFSSRSLLRMRQKWTEMDNRIFNLWIYCVFSLISSRQFFCLIRSGKSINSVWHIIIASFLSLSTNYSWAFRWFISHLLSHCIWSNSLGLRAMSTERTTASVW